jgi:hypothetical protein
MQVIRAKADDDEEPAPTMGFYEVNYLGSCQVSQYEGATRMTSHLGVLTVARLAGRVQCLQGLSGAAARERKVHKEG